MRPRERNTALPNLVDALTRRLRKPKAGSTGAPTTPRNTPTTIPSNGACDFATRATGNTTVGSQRVSSLGPFSRAEDQNSDFRGAGIAPQKEGKGYAGSEPPTAYVMAALTVPW